MSKKAVLFDLDGVICDTAKYHYLAWKKAANAIGGDIDEEFNEQLKGVDRHNSLLKILKHNDIVLEPKKFNELLELKNEWYLEYIEKLTKDDILPGIETLLIKLKEENIFVSIASASKNAPLIINSLGLEKYVDAIANPEAVLNSKPEPDIFIEAARLVNIPLEECVGIEDSKAGIKALNKIGVTSIGIGEDLTSSTITVSTTEMLSFDLVINGIL